MLQIPEHAVHRARFPVIDVHQHVNDAMHLFDQRIAGAELIEIMDRCNLLRIVVLTGLWGERLQTVLDQMVHGYPARFAVFTQIDWSQLGRADFARMMVRQVRDAVSRGARGLKVLKDLGLTVRDESGQVVAIDDPRLDPIWAECGRLGIPVAIHAADPEAFFHPVDGANERYEELIANPEWSFSGPGYPAHHSILEALCRTLAKHPDTIFIGLHLIKPENLDYVSGILDRFSNVSVEFGARQAELGRQPRRASEFFSKYQDRILFGTDHPVSEAMYQTYFRWLESADEYFEYWGYPRQGRWKIYGLALPDQILEKIYHLNAEKIFNHFTG